MVSKKQQVGADLSRLESKATNLKATLKIYTEQRDKQLKLVKTEFGLSGKEEVDKMIKKLASELVELQAQRDKANSEAIRLLSKME